MIVSSGLVVLALGQLPLVWVFIRGLRRRSPPPDPTQSGRPSTPVPKAAMILCLRGPDPFLAETLQAAVAQDYADYRLFVVIDHPDDPAWCVVEQTLGAPPPQHVEFVQLSNRRETCSLKCSSLVQVVENLDESFDFVALLDADTVPHRTWLAELAAPLADPLVGAATGNRWYMPGQRSWGALVRYLWNAAAVVQMYCYGIPWGGTLAVKLAELRETDLLDRWAHAFCEDTMLFAALRRRGRRVAFVPTLMMVNRESCSLGGFFRWVRRQLLTARLYHPGWPAVLFHGLITTFGLGVGAGGLAVALAMQLWNAAFWLASGLLVYGAAMPVLLGVLERGARAVVAPRGEPVDWMHRTTPLWLVAAIPLTQAVYFAALLSAAFTRRVDWRGVVYQVDGPRQIRLLEYEPFRSEIGSPEEVSL
ncbi:MAG: glycosyltransferase family 2 protein [Thermoguttaceae bacterium]|nr:glycosyltransferase family 2 protein [Thermoguttaceae bacterium]